MIRVTSHFILIEIASACALLPFAYGLKRFRQRPPYLKLLCLAMGLAFVVDQLSAAMYLLRVDLGAFRNVFGILGLSSQFEIYLLIFFMAHSYKYRRFYLSIAIGFLIVFFGNLALVQHGDVNTNSTILSFVILISFSLYFFYTMLRDLPTEGIPQLPMFWVTAGFLIYFSGGLFFYIVYTYLVEISSGDFHLLILFLDVKSIMSLLSNLILTMAFIQKDSFVTDEPHAPVLKT